MGFLDRLRKAGDYVASEHHADGSDELHVGDARFDDWAVVKDFNDLEAARAWRQVLTEHGLDSALTSDWPLDDYGKGDIALRVPQDHWSEADALLDAEPDD